MGPGAPLAMRLWSYREPFPRRSLQSAEDTKRHEVGTRSHGLVSACGPYHTANDERTCIDRLKTYDQPRAARTRIDALLRTFEIAVWSYHRIPQGALHSMIHRFLAFIELLSLGAATIGLRRTLTAIAGQVLHTRRRAAV